MLSNSDHLMSNDISSLFRRNYLLLISTLFSVIYCSIYILLSFKNIKIKKFYKFLKALGINASPFKMFTERNTENMISFYVHINSFNNFINPFLRNGLRSSSQNFNTRLYHDLLYPMSDYLIINSQKNLKMSI